MSPAKWYVEPDSFGNPTLWAPNEDRPDYPIALLVRVPSNAVLFDGIGALLDQVAQVAADALEIDRERIEAEARAAELEADLLNGDACGAVGCRALGDRDAADERLRRGRRILADFNTGRIGQAIALIRLSAALGADEPTPCACGTDATAMDPAEVVIHDPSGCRIERVHAALTEAEDQRQALVDLADSQGVDEDWGDEF